MSDKDREWLGDLRWQGYPSLQPARDVSAVEQDLPAPGAPRRAPEARLEDLAKENEALRSKLAALSRLAAEFDRRLAEAGTAYEGAILEAESRQREIALERERLVGQLEAAKAECTRLSARDAAREADLKLERERRADSEKALLEARRRLEELTSEADRLRAAASEQSGMLAELRRQAASQNERLLQSKVITDQDIHMMRQEMRDVLAKLQDQPSSPRPATPPEPLR